MGRTSKFSFPIPGRKHSSSKEALASPEPSRTSTYNISKAQRVLGTENELNIDSPTQTEYAFGFPSPRPSRMSISISESTNESASLGGSQSEQWDRESGVFPRGQRFGQRYGDDGTTSLSSGRLRHEDSSSTLRSHYDRQKSPLSISQQTSESSARDLALRKGFPPVSHRSPLLQVDLVDPFDKDRSRNNKNAEESRQQADFSRDRGSKKKPAKLDLSRLFPKSRRGSKSSDADSLATSAKSISTNASRTPRTSGDPGHRKLTKRPSKESIQSRLSIHSSQSHEPKKRNSSLTSGTGNSTLYQLYDHYEHMPVPSPRMDQIPETKVPERIGSLNQDGLRPTKPESYPRQPRDRDSVRSPVDIKEPFSWKNVRSSMGRPEPASSAGSVSSRNTKTSRHTSTSGISSADLKLNSVLSLSSDSEGEGSDRDAVKSPTLSSKSKASKSSASQKPSSTHRHSRQPSGGLTPRSHSSRNNSKKAGQDSHFQSIPESSSTDAQYARRTAKEEPSRSSIPAKEPRQSSHREKRSSKKPTIAPVGLQPTPPLSPTSIELQEEPKGNSRLMAVTKQEEALLAALRLKRARMRDEIIEEHEIRKSPPRIPAKNGARHSKNPSTSSVRDSGKQSILLYLDTPISDSHQIDMAEPSPDLSDFLTFGSDDDSTPRTSWAPPARNQARPDSTTRPRGNKTSPLTPQSAARLSAVGSPGFFEDGPVEPVIGAKKQNTGVRFMDEPKLVNVNDFLDDSEAEAMWGV